MAMNDGEQAPLAEHEYLRAMPTMERKEKLERCFDYLRLNGMPLADFQKQQLKKAMEVR